MKNELEYDKESMLHWFPRISNLDIPHPETEIVRIPNDVLKEIVEVYSKRTRLIGENVINDILDKLLPFPIFLRTDMSSQKKMFKKTCRLPNRKSLFGHVLEIVNANIDSGIKDNALVFRKWLDLDAGFFAFDGLPIAVEARAYIDGGKVIGVEPYWKEENILNPQNPQWRKILKYQNKMINASEDKLLQYSKIIGSRFQTGKWSVDFALERNGNWYLIDMGNIPDKDVF